MIPDVGYDPDIGGGAYTRSEYDNPIRYHNQDCSSKLTASETVFALWNPVALQIGSSVFAVRTIFPIKGFEAKYLNYGSRTRTFRSLLLIF